MDGDVTVKPTMDPAVKAAWVAALRSGKYKQTSGRLRHAGGFCCLGVLCEVIETPRAFYGYKFELEGGENTSNHNLPFYFLPRDIQNQLSTMNDKYGASFEEIADWIEANL